MAVEIALDRGVRTIKKQVRATERWREANRMISHEQERRRHKEEEEEKEEGRRGKCRHHEEAERGGNKYGKGSRLGGNQWQRRVLGARGGRGRKKTTVQGPLYARDQGEEEKAEQKLRTTTTTMDNSPTPPTPTSPSLSSSVSTSYLYSFTPKMSRNPSILDFMECPGNE